MRETKLAEVFNSVGIQLIKALNEQDEKHLEINCSGKWSSIDFIKENAVKTEHDLHIILAPGDSSKMQGYWVIWITFLHAPSKPSCDITSFQERPPGGQNKAFLYCPPVILTRFAQPKCCIVLQSDALTDKEISRVCASAESHLRKKTQTRGDLGFVLLDVPPPRMATIKLQTSWQWTFHQWQAQVNTQYFNYLYIIFLICFVFRGTTQPNPVALTS